MRTWLLALATLAAFAIPTTSASAASADSAGNAKMKACADQWNAMKKAGTAKGSYADFSKSCLSGQAATSAAVSARCKDGTSWSGSTRSGACSNHGGVATWK